MNAYAKLTAFLRCKSGAVASDGIALTAIVVAVGLGVVVTSQSERSGSPPLFGESDVGYINFSSPSGFDAIWSAVESFDLGETVGKIRESVSFN